MPGTRTRKVDTTNEVSVETFDEFMEGYPESQQELPSPREPYNPNIVGNVVDAPPEVVTLVNLRYPNEQVFTPVYKLNAQGEVVPTFSPQDWVTFTDGLLITDRKTADHVIKVSPYVIEEPKEGEIFTYPTSGFSTRSAKAYQEHVTRFNEDFVN